MLLARAHPCDYGNFICTFFGHMSSNDESSTQTAPRGNLLHARHANYGQTWGKVACVSQRRRVKRRQKKMIFVKLVGVRSKTQLFPWPTHFSPPSSSESLAKAMRRAGRATGSALQEHFSALTHFPLASPFFRAHMSV